MYYGGDLLVDGVLRVADSLRIQTIIVALAYLNKVELDFSRLGKPTDNAFIEAFIGRLRQECLNASRFLSLADARQRIADWRIDYIEERTHSALRNLAPSAFAAQLKQSRKVARIPDQRRGKVQPVMHQD